MSPAVGDMIAGKYRVERVLGEGGMGVVVVAMHTALDQRVALKMLRPGVVSDGDVLARFAREARAAARIQSEHVARVLDVTTTGEGAPVLVMEYLEGCDLEQLLAARGALPIAVAADYVLQACEAIAEAHAAGIVHRDLKPANLFLADRADGTRVIKVLDFGISKLASGAGDSVRDVAVTHGSAIFGSPLYMAPEQLASTHAVDARADVWSLVVVLFELVTGSPPFDGATVPVVTTRILTAPTPALAARGIDAPPALEALVQRGLEKRRERRFEDVAELARALGPFAPPSAGSSVARISRVLRAAQPASRESEPTSIPSLSSTLRPPIPADTPRPSPPSSPRARPRLGALLVLGGLLGSGGTIALVARSPATPPPMATVPATGATAIAQPMPVMPPPLSPLPVAPIDAGAQAAGARRPSRVNASRLRTRPASAPEPSGTAAFGGRQ